MKGTLYFGGHHYKFELQEHEITLTMTIAEKDNWAMSAKKNKYQFDVTFCAIDDDGIKYNIFTDGLTRAYKDGAYGYITLRVAGVIQLLSDNLNENCGIAVCFSEHNVISIAPPTSIWTYFPTEQYFCYGLSDSSDSLVWDKILKIISAPVDTLRFLSQKNEFPKLYIYFIGHNKIIGYLYYSRLSKYFNPHLDPKSCTEICSQIPVEKLQSLILTIGRDEKYMAHIESELIPHIITPGWFITTIAAFEWEVRSLNITESGATKKAKEIAANAIEDKMNQETGKIKKHLKTILKFVKSEKLDLNTKLLSTFKEYHKFYLPLSDRAYELYEDDVKKGISSRLQKQRNDFAHGNIDEAIQPMAAIDIIFLRKFIFCFQLDQCGFEFELVRFCYQKVFGNDFDYYQNKCDAIQSLEDYIKQHESTENSDS